MSRRRNYYWTFVSCSSCEFKHFTANTAPYEQLDPTTFYEHIDGRTFPLKFSSRWCLECNTLTFHELIPSQEDITTELSVAESLIGFFDTSDASEWERKDSDKQCQILKNQDLWRSWAKSRMEPRCLACGSVYEHDLSLDDIVGAPLGQEKKHPRCRGTLTVGEEFGESPPTVGSAWDIRVENAIYTPSGLLGEKLYKMYAATLDVTQRILLQNIEQFLRDCVASDSEPMSNPIEHADKLGIRPEMLRFIQIELGIHPFNEADPAAFSRAYPELFSKLAYLVRTLVQRSDVSMLKKALKPSTEKAMPDQMADGAPNTSASVPGPQAESEIFRTPFAILGVSTRDSRKRIVDAAEEKSLEGDHDACQKARADLTNPRLRLSAEMAWLPGVSPSKATQLLETVLHDWLSLWGITAIPALAHINLLAATFDAVESTTDGAVVVDMITDIAHRVDALSADKVLREVNEDRAVSGFPEVREVALVEAELAERKRYIRKTIKNALDQLPSLTLVQVMTDAVNDVTSGGKVHAPTLIDDLVDSYEVETQGILQREADLAGEIVKFIRSTAVAGPAAIASRLDKLCKVARNWDRIAQPIQLSAMARGTTHEPSRDLAYEIRSLAIDLFNKHDMLDESAKLTDLLGELFREVPEIAERVEKDSDDLADIVFQRQKAAEKKTQWVDEISYSADIGIVFKNRLSISPQGVSWKGKSFPLESITRVRWGSVRHSVNGIPTGTNHTVAFGDNQSEAVAEFSNAEIFGAFTDKLWRAVCVRMLGDILKQVKSGQTLRFGDAILQDDGVVLPKVRLFAANQSVHCPWSELRVNSHNGSLNLFSVKDKKITADLPYLTTPNAHLLEHLIRIFFKDGKAYRLSDLLA